MAPTRYRSTGGHRPKARAETSLLAEGQRRSKHRLYPAQQPDPATQPKRASASPVARLEPRASIGATCARPSPPAAAATAGPSGLPKWVARARTCLPPLPATMIVHRSAPPAAIGAPTVVPTARPRSTLAPLTRRLALPSFVQPVLILAVGTAALSAAAGYLPVLGARHHLDPLATGARVSLMAATAALIQPWAGQAPTATAWPRPPGRSRSSSLPPASRSGRRSPSPILPAPARRSPRANHGSR